MTSNSWLDFDDDLNDHDPDPEISKRIYHCGIRAVLNGTFGDLCGLDGSLRSSNASSAFSLVITGTKCLWRKSVRTVRWVCFSRPSHNSTMPVLPPCHYRCSYSFRALLPDFTSNVPVPIYLIDPEKRDMRGQHFLADLHKYARTVWPPEFGTVIQVKKGKVCHTPTGV